MNRVQMTDEEERLYTLFKLRQLEEEFDDHKRNETALLSSGEDGSLTKNLVELQQSIMGNLDRRHTKLRNKLKASSKPNKP